MTDDCRRAHRRVVVVGEQDPLAARRPLRLQRLPQAWVAHLAAQMPLRLAVDQPHQPLPPREPDGAQLVLQVRGGPVQPEQAGHAAEGRPQSGAVRPVGFRDDVRGVELDDRRVRRPRDDVRHELDRARPGADHRHPPSGQVVVVPPVRRVERRAGEVLETRQGRDGGAGELPAGGHEHVGPERAAVGEVEHPAAAGLVEPRRGDLDAEPDPGQHPEPLRDVLQVGADLRLRRVAAAPVGFRGEREGVQGRRDVTGGAGIAIGRPHAADPVRALQDRHVLDAGPHQPDGHADPAEAGADDRDRGGAGRQRRPPELGTGARSRYVQPSSRRTHR